MKKALSALLAAVMVLGLAAVSASAADVNIQATLPAIVLGTASDTPTKVGFGGKQWAVIGYNGTGVASTSGSKLLTLLLASDQTFGNSYFKQNSPYSNEYSGSDLQTAMDNAFNGIANSKEKAQVAGRDLTGGGALYSDPNTTGYDADKIAGPNVNGAKFWPLSAGEAAQLNNTVRTTGCWWWLRSPGYTLFTLPRMSSMTAV